MHHADRAAVPGARALLVLFDEAHRPEFRRAGNGHRPGMAEEGVEGVHAFAQPALDMVDGVDEARIHLDLAPADDAHRARLADAALVVAVDVRTHGQFGLVLLRVEQFQDLFRIRNRIVAALDGAGDRAGLDAAAVDAHEHFRRGADQVFAFAEIDEEGVGRRVDLLQPARDLGGRRFAALVEHLARHHLEEVAALETLLGLLHQLCVFAGRMVAARRDAGRWLERFFPAATRQALGGEAVAGIVVAVVPGQRLVMIDDEDLVGQIKHEVALAVGALQREVDRVELEGKVVAEGAVEAEIGILLRPEQAGDGTQHGEHRWNAAALLFREDAAGRRDVEPDRASRTTPRP